MLTFKISFLSSPPVGMQTTFSWTCRDNKHTLTSAPNLIIE